VRPDGRASCDPSPAGFRAANDIYTHLAKNPYKSLIEVDFPLSWQRLTIEVNCAQQPLWIGKYLAVSIQFLPMPWRYSWMRLGERTHWAGAPLYNAEPSVSRL
jgi:hypothetical protein